MIKLIVGLVFFVTKGWMLFSIIRRTPRIAKSIVHYQVRADFTTITLWAFSVTMFIVLQWMLPEPRILLLAILSVVNS